MKIKKEIALKGVFVLTIIFLLGFTVWGYAKPHFLSESTKNEILKDSVILGNNQLDLSGFNLPSDHVDYFKKDLFGDCGEVLNGAVSYIYPNGGGPFEQHTHDNDHLVVIVRGQAKVLLADTFYIIHENESYIVKGDIPHSIWNNSSDTTILVGITLKANHNHQTIK